MINEKSNLFFPEDINDIRNNAIIIVYGEPINAIDSLFRDKNIAKHIKYFRMIKKSSLIARNILGDLKDDNHYYLDQQLSFAGHVVFFPYDIINKENKECVIFLPEHLSEFQIDFFLQKEKYFSIYEEIAIEQNGEEVNSEDYKNGVKTLYDIIYKEKERHHSRL